MGGAELADALCSDAASALAAGGSRQDDPGERQQIALCDAAAESYTAELTGEHGRGSRSCWPTAKVAKAVHDVKSTLHALSDTGMELAGVEHERDAS